MIRCFNNKIIPLAIRTVSGSSCRTVSSSLRIQSFSFIIKPNNLDQSFSFSTKPNEALKIKEKFDVKPELDTPCKRNEINLRDLKRLLQNDDILLIDVRDRSDIEKHGFIPNAIHIPLNKLKTTLKLTENEFKSAFNRKKPDYNSDKLIFYGYQELKSTSACEIAYSLGYKKARSFPGGFKQWCENDLDIYQVDRKE